MNNTEGVVGSVIFVAAQRILGDQPLRLNDGAQSVPWMGRRTVIPKEKKMAKHWESTTAVPRALRSVTEMERWLPGLDWDYQWENWRVM
jgi:hypothetical protein